MKKALIIGMGKSGKAAKALLEKKGYYPVCFDGKGGELPKNLDLVILSPGVPPSHTLVQQAQAASVEVIGEMELGLRYLQQRAIGITGTNGKTTTTLLITHALQSSRIKARAVGNVGLPLCEYLLAPNLKETLVLEFSSFQLETCTTKALESAILLNITPDHLDRYENFEAYAKTKFRIGELCETLWLGEDVKKIFETYSPTRDTREYNEVSFLQSIGADAAQARESFVYPQHRFERLKTLHGVEFVNDSKATNVEAVLHALKQVDRSVLLLVGGRDKGANFMDLLPSLKKVRKIFAFGEAGGKIEMALKGSCEISRFGTLEESFAQAAKEAKEGEMVLLSPACSSLDAFANFEKRGEKFKQMVEELS
ncbi:MAG: UDP-N-acetylmuramoyl-L-alanine--D-glutamate ligase [Candidatus Algichlamydia australiensis]|nr:UDP-N-acetylmuramoyl-L-alanine--D-glutamate ligase [Chlamydiales bacterium]